MAPTRPTPLTPYTPYPTPPPSLPHPTTAPPSPFPPSPLPAPLLTLQPTPLTSTTFAPYGTVITPPPPTPTTNYPPHQLPTPPPPNAIPANQSTALKYPSIAHQTHTYHLSPSGTPAHHATSLYSSYPRKLRAVVDQKQHFKKKEVFDVRILERHPFTTQTFIPIAGGKEGKEMRRGRGKGRAIIIVAPTLPIKPGVGGGWEGTPYFPQRAALPSPSSAGGATTNYGIGGGGGGGLPDLRNIKAFVAEEGQGVMYAAGTWHAPMVVVGEGRVDFVVSQWMSGRKLEDCEEVALEEGVVVEVGEGEGKSGGGRAKL